MPRNTKRQGAARHQVSHFTARRHSIHTVLPKEPRLRKQLHLWTTLPCTQVHREVSDTRHYAKELCGETSPQTRNTTRNLRQVESRPGPALLDIETSPRSPLAEARRATHHQTASTTTLFSCSCRDSPARDDLSGPTSSAGRHPGQPHRYKSTWPLPQHPWARHLSTERRTAFKGDARLTEAKTALQTWRWWDERQRILRATEARGSLEGAQAGSTRTSGSNGNPKTAKRGA